MVFISQRTQEYMINTHIFKPQEYKGEGRDKGVGDGYGAKTAKVSFR